VKLWQRLKAALSPEPWKKYDCITTHSGKKVWLRKRKGKAPLYMMSFDPGSPCGDYSANVLLRCDNGWDLIVVGVEYAAAAEKEEGL
jgi:hypothetical protein